METQPTTSLRAAAMGFLTGLRSVTPLAATAGAISAGKLQPGSMLALAGRKPIARLLVAGAAGELAFDKLPQAISRTALPSQVGRITNGAVTGALIADSMGGRIGVGAIAGGTGGLLGTRIGYSLRVQLTRRLPVPSIVVALLEDAVAVGGSLLVLRSVQQEMQDVP